MFRIFGFRVPCLREVSSVLNELWKISWCDLHRSAAIRTSNYSDHRAYHFQDVGAPADLLDL